MGNFASKSFWISTFILLIVGSGCATRPPAYQQATGMPSVVTFSGPGASMARQDLYHEVGPMETLWRIAKEYDVNPNTIVQVNRIQDPNQLKIGQRLLIPKARSVRPVIPLYNVRPWSYIIIHHTATESGNAISINNSHQKRGFWGGLGYHFLIDNGTMGKQNGQIEISPRWIKQQDGAHCNVAGMNQHGIGIAVVGNYSESKMSDAQLESLVFLTTTLMKYYQVPLKNVMGHRDVPGKQTECPGTRFPWQEFMKRLRYASRA